VKITLCALGIGLAVFAATQRPWALGSGLSGPWAKGPMAQGPQSLAPRAQGLLRASFHHIHINDTAPEHLVGYYGKLFNSATTRPTRLGDFGGVEAEGLYLLITPVPRPPLEEASAGWHFGWGTVSVDEPYDRHRMQEIEWELPLESFAKNLHLHLESASPMAAGEWYRDVFGAVLETQPANAAVQPINAYYRRPVAIARFERVALAIYKADRPLPPSRGHRIDHIAFKVSELAAVRDALTEARIKLLEPAGRLGPHDTVTIEGPDQLAIELVGAPILRRQ
jgi:catechol 2,3-dioxygenase-like lactoylglutathione lyase family enzyme